MAFLCQGDSTLLVSRIQTLYRTPVVAR